jgi:hypothetical protein
MARNADGRIFPRNKKLFVLCRVDYFSVDENEFTNKYSNDDGTV